MKTFYCTQCGTMVFFENTRCLKCDHPLGFRADALEMAALDKTGDDEWKIAGGKDGGQRYRHCANGQQHNVCNWLVPASDTNAWCVACRLNELIPDLTAGNNIQRWAKLELAKRRCIYTFLMLGLPVVNAPGDSRPPLRFKFLEDKPNQPVKTGHENGMISINVAEADEDERERRRLNLHEPYRTLVGHFRHESGHFYWDRLIQDSPELGRYRELFGDETASYAAALEAYYKNGPAEDWQERTVTAYASSHSWEDWAETWAHYLHILDTLESAASFNLRIRETTTQTKRTLPVEFSPMAEFDDLLFEWTPLTCALNAINRSMGLADLYPFVIPAPVVEKLRFIHEIVRKSGSRQNPKP